MLFAHASNCSEFNSFVVIEKFSLLYNEQIAWGLLHFASVRIYTLKKLEWCWPPNSRVEGKLLFVSIDNFLGDTLGILFHCMCQNP